MEVEKLLKSKFRDRFFNNLSFKKVTTFKIGGKIRYFVYVLNEKELVFLLKFCKKKKMNYLIIGGGSNVLASDGCFDGVVISTLNMTKIKFLKNNIVECMSGVRLSNLIYQCMKKECGGLEWAIGIPGTIGGACVMNAGAFGGQISDFVVSVKCFNGNKIENVNGEQLEFAYRDSFFKKNKNYVILSVKLQLFPEKSGKILQNVQNCIQKRKSLQSVGFPSAGSVFKRSPDVLPAALIDNLGLKGFRIGDAMVSDVHSGYIVNLSNATCKDVLKLIDFISNSVYNRFNRKLELEIIVIGDNDGELSG